MMIKRAFHVDDSGISQRFVRDTLRLVDPALELVCFTSAKEAIAKLEGLSSDAFPDVIFTDQAMPGMDGVDFLRWLKSHPRYHLIPVIMVSAESEEHRKKKVLALGVFQYLEKPLQGDHVILALEAVEQKLHQANADREAEVHLTEEVMNRVGECAKLLETLTTSSLQEIKRHLHTIKGNAFSYQYPVLGEFIHDLERTLDRVDSKSEVEGKEDSALKVLLELSLQYIREQALGIFEARAVKIDQPVLFKLLRDFGKPPEAPPAPASNPSREDAPKTQAQTQVKSKSASHEHGLNDAVSTRIPNEKIEQIQEEVKKVVQVANRLSAVAKSLSKDSAGDSPSAELSRIQEELADRASRMVDFFISIRLVPLSRIRDLVSRIVPETSQKLSREVEYTL